MTSSGSVASRRSGWALGAVLLSGLALRVAYLSAQPAVDPTFSRPTLDGGYYLDWARALVAGRDHNGDAYYLGPLFPHALALFLAVAGEQFFLLYLCQHLLVLAGIGVLAWTALRMAGSGAALSVAALGALHHPLIFLASQPLAEPLALFLLAVTLSLLARETPRSAFWAGVAAGLTALARPSLLLVPMLWG
ncbi:MAG: hypothetical protein ACREKS_17730, partial [Candidatus Rokuibacteriota bacterium]